MKTLRKINTWSGEYKGIQFKISNWKISYSPDCWAYYLYIYEDDPLTKKLFPKFWEHSEENYWLYNCPLVEDLPWHGGCTYLNRKVSNGSRYIKAGCDYQHLNDQGCYYTESILLTDIQETIDALITLLNEHNPSDKIPT